MAVSSFTKMFFKMEEKQEVTTQQQLQCIHFFVSFLSFIVSRFLE